nr:hypothetical protein [Micromonospora sp. DSM 115978]
SQAVVDIATGLLPGGDGDLIGRASLTWDTEQLDAVKKSGKQPWSLRVGKTRSEGLYELAGTIAYAGDHDGPGRPGSLAARVSEFTVALDRVTCLEESGTDGVFTPSDEVYLLTTFTNHTGLPVPPDGTTPVEGWLSPVWNSVDSGDVTTQLTKTWTLRVPTLAGAATLGVEAWEEDNETAQARS